MALKGSVRKRQKTTWRKKAWEKRAGGEEVKREIKDIKKELARMRERMLKERKEQLEKMKKIPEALSREDLKLARAKLKEMKEIDVRIPGVPKTVTQGVGALILSRELLKNNIELLNERLSRTHEKRAQTLMELERSMGELNAVNSLLREYNEIEIEGQGRLVDAVYNELKERRMEIEEKRAEKLEKKSKRTKT